MVSRDVAITAVALSPEQNVEDQLLDVARAVISGFSFILNSLVLIVVRLIIGGRVAVGGFARS